MSSLLPYVLLYVATFITCIVLDLTWLTIVAKNFYTKHLGFLLTPSPNLWAALLFYMIFITGLLVFVVLPGLKQNSLTHTVLKGFLFGLVVYSAYDLTNHATIKDWPLVVTVVDMLWGACVACVVSTISFLVAKTFIV